MYAMTWRRTKYVELIDINRQIMKMSSLSIFLIKSFLFLSFFENLFEHSFFFHLVLNKFVIKNFDRNLKDATIRRIDIITCINKSNGKKTRYDHK